jgi:hypothetical protein
MNHIILVVRFSLAISSLFVVSLLIGSLIGNVMVQATEQSVNNASSYTPTNSTLNIGSPHKVTIPFHSQQQPTLLSEAKKQQLMQSHPHSPPLPSSGKPIQGPAPGTQTSP